MEKYSELLGKLTPEQSGFLYGFDPQYFMLLNLQISDKRDQKVGQQMTINSSQMIRMAGTMSVMDMYKAKAGEKLLVAPRDVPCWIDNVRVKGPCRSVALYVGDVMVSRIQALDGEFGTCLKGTRLIPNHLKIELEFDADCDVCVELCVILKTAADNFENHLTNKDIHYRIANHDSFDGPVTKKMNLYTGFWMALEPSDDDIIEFRGETRPAWTCRNGPVYLWRFGPDFNPYSSVFSCGMPIEKGPGPELVVGASVTGERRPVKSWFVNYRTFVASKNKVRITNE